MITQLPIWVTFRNPVEASFVRVYQPAINPQVQPYILALGKYRQTQDGGDKNYNKAIALLGQQCYKTAARTALQMGDKGAGITTSATRLHPVARSGSQENAIVPKTGKTISTFG